MPLVIACPTCQQKIRAPESVIGRQIKCPQCKTPFVAQDSSSVGVAAGSPAATVREQLPPQQEFPAVPPATQAWPGNGEEAPEETEPSAREKAPRGSFVDYLLFRRMITPWIIIVVFYLGVAGILIYGLVMFVLDLGLMVAAARSGGGGLAVALTLLYALGVFLATLVSLVMWRVYCEVIATFFRILDNVREINEQLKERKN
ncbi:MAG TPA: DUF4282 domain-containing protein [Gemmataceae bacterium]|jgi:hypothetical protein|nr:DUF4282 domain-containing protein [Gemmataceae bacterium]